MSDFPIATCTQDVFQVQLPDVLTATSSSGGFPRVPKFLELLCNWPTGIPLESFWIVEIVPIYDRYLLDQLRDISNIELDTAPSNGKGWSISEGLTHVFNDETQSGGVIGCSFATGVSTPDEQFGIGFAGVQNNRGFMRGPIGDHRRDLTECKIKFMETNSSIVDNFIRPWTILASHKGLFAWDEQHSIKANIHAYMFRKNGYDKDPVCRKRVSYFEAVPYSIAGEELTRDEPTSISERLCSFAYNGYTVSDGTDRR